MSRAQRWGWLPVLLATLPAAHARPPVDPAVAGCAEQIPDSPGLEPLGCPYPFTAEVVVWLTDASCRDTMDYDGLELPRRCDEAKIGAARQAVIDALGADVPILAGSSQGLPTVRVVGSPPVFEALEGLDQVVYFYSDEPRQMGLRDGAGGATRGASRGHTLDDALGEPAPPPPVHIDWSWARGEGYRGTHRREQLDALYNGADILECRQRHLRLALLEQCPEQVTQVLPLMAGYRYQPLTLKMCDRAVHLVYAREEPVESAERGRDLITAELTRLHARHELKHCLGHTGVPDDLLWLECRALQGSHINHGYCVSMQQQLARIATPHDLPAEGQLVRNAFYRYDGNTEPLLALLTANPTANHKVAIHTANGRRLACYSGTCVDYSDTDPRPSDLGPLPALAEPGAGGDPDAQRHWSENQTDPARCTDPGIHTESCLMSLALHLRDPALCDGLPQEVSREGCTTRVAVQVGDPAICERITRLYPDGRKRNDHCYADVARYHRDPGICERVQSARLRKSCVRQSSP